MSIVYESGGSDSLVVVVVLAVPLAGRFEVPKRGVFPVSSRVVCRQGLNDGLKGKPKITFSPFAAPSSFSMTRVGNGFKSAFVLCR